MGKLDGNERWKSSFILPEFSEAFEAYRMKSRERIRPDLDDDHKQSISQMLVESLKKNRAITLRLYGLYEPSEVTGIVTRIDPDSKIIRLQTFSSCLNIPFMDIETIY